MALQKNTSITAILGPTNTGKTHFAIERMLGHETGMIGFPLRLLARENYDRVVQARGAGSVALITGEEKIVPANPRYFVCTVESMPLDRVVAFLAVDEIQLAADKDRGHLFTARMLHARGLEETMFLGSATIKPLIRKLIPGIQFITRPRLSRLTHTGPKKLTRLPRRSTVVAFSLSEVYGIAELIRRQRGGAAVVMGALSPRTRNAQVAMYQRGEVDYMVATDAIGMGLNIDIDHVAFASLTKFDGHRSRPLSALEVAQIAGRAGRHMNDGTFGGVAGARSLNQELVLRVENHEFPFHQSIYWRNSDLQFLTLDKLILSLKRPPTLPGLIRCAPAEDQLVLEAMIRDDDVRRQATTPDSIKLLWEVAQVPDFRKVRPENHARILTQVYCYLMDRHNALPEDWISSQVSYLDRTDGDIHTIMDRISGIRIWTYIANRSQWLREPKVWQVQTRHVEDRLSDALHEKLIGRFVDKRTSHLVKRLRNSESLTPTVHDDGSVFVDGHRLGCLSGLRFKAERTGIRAADRAVINAASNALGGVIAARVNALLAARDEELALSDQGEVMWEGCPLGTIGAGSDILSPVIGVTREDTLDIESHKLVVERLQRWLDAYLQHHLEKLHTARDANIGGPGRGLVFQVIENLGTLPSKKVVSQTKNLSPAERKVLARIGMRFGVRSVFMIDLLKAETVRLRGLLWLAYHPGAYKPKLPPAGRVSVPLEPQIPKEFYEACGFCVVHKIAYRIDMIERFGAQVRSLAREGHRHLPSELLSLLGANAKAGQKVLQSFGYAASIKEGVVAFHPRRRKGTEIKNRRENGLGEEINEESPFSALKDLISA